MLPHAGQQSEGAAISFVVLIFVFVSSADDLVAVISAAVKVTQGAVSKKRLVQFKALKGVLNSF